MYPLGMTEGVFCYDGEKQGDIWHIITHATRTATYEENTGLDLRRWGYLAISADDPYTTMSQVIASILIHL